MMRRPGQRTDIRVTGADAGPDTFRLVDGGWGRVFDDAMVVAGDRLRIICPFIKRGVIARLLHFSAPASIEVITRFDLRAFCDEVSDVEALALLLERGARIRGVRNLHAKVYQFGSARAIVTSANLTRAALCSNHEFGFVSDEPGILRRCEQYFDDLWVKAGPDVTADRVAGWQETVDRHRLRGAPPHLEGFTDEGVDVGLSEEDSEPVLADELPFRSFVKFFGEGGNRVDRSWLIEEEVKRAGCHWACAYPLGKRPRQVEDGSIMIMARLVARPDDIVIFGRAIGLRHQPGRDDATAEEVEQRSWKAKWPHYVRVHHAEFLSGSLNGGVSLKAIMEELGPDTFLTTQRHARDGDGNTDPRRAYMRQAHVELSPQGYQLITERLEDAFEQHGRMSPAMLDALDWPN